MNFMQWLNLLNDLLYEIVSWIVFFPITLWKIIRHPLAMMDYADTQLSEPARSNMPKPLARRCFWCWRWSSRMPWNWRWAAE